MRCLLPHPGHSVEKMLNMTQTCLTRACKISSDWFSIPEAAQMLFSPAYDTELNTAASQAATSTVGYCKTVSFTAQASE